jgi:hypothetical protein
MYLHLALGCDFPILEAYSKAVYRRKERQSWKSLESLHISHPDGPGTARIHFKNNQIHRTEGPAVVFEDGSYIWYFWGKVSRQNGPALSFRNGVMKWKVNGLLHRTDGPALMTEQIKIWAIDGNYHRQDGPAVECGYTLEQLRKDKHFNSANCLFRTWRIEFYTNGLLHREYPHVAKIKYTLGKPILVEFWNKGQLERYFHVLGYSELEPYL